MNARTSSRWLLAMAIFLALTLATSFRAHAESEDVRLQSWQIQWIKAGDASEDSPSATAGWISSGSSDPSLSIPAGSVGMWTRISVPSAEAWIRPALLVDRIYGMKISVFEEGRLLLEDNRSFRFERNKLLVPLDGSPKPKSLYIKIISGERSGIASDIEIGEFDELSERFVRREVPDILLGGSISALALILTIGTGFLNRRQRGAWVSLCLVVLSTGMLILSYNPLPYIYFPEAGPALLFLFDVWMFVLFPALHSYLDSVFEGRYKFFTRFGRAITGYSIFCFLILLAYRTVGESFYPVYELFTVMLLGVVVLVQMILILVLSVSNAFRGNMNSILLSAGFLILALSGAADLVLFYMSETQYVLFLWKIGVVAMLVALLLILARQISANYARVVAYSKELELYAQQLQRTEKMKVVSELAASVAHEVRNPMQVTRGFLQFLSHKSDRDNKGHFALAIQELDRASGIINEFLAFAKPEIETTGSLNLYDELRKVEAMIGPLAALQGGEIRLICPDRLYIRGNASKLTQALLNLVKNSIEAIDGEEGIIRIEAYAEEGMAVILIADNGAGMDESELARLGEPFFSTKTDGTGLGLMATYRIVEVMRGTLEFRGTKGEGVEAIIRFPILEE